MIHSQNEMEIPTLKVGTTFYADFNYLNSMAAGKSTNGVSFRRKTYFGEVQLETKGNSMRTTSSIIQEYKALFDEESLTLDEYTFLKDNLLKQGDKEFEEGENVVIASRQQIAAEKKDERRRTLTDVLGKAGTFAIIAAMIILCIVIIKGCVGFISDLGSDTPDYETYYEDDNGNGQLDNGEWNYTVDEDGNVVDIDDDLSNFE